jgi:ABC-type sugar transport system permease subunit
MKKGTVNRKKLKQRIFIVSMLAYPVLHFLVFWVYVNFDAILLTFQRYILMDENFNFINDYVWVGLDNYRIVITRIIQNEFTRDTVINSLLYFPLTCLVSLPLSIVFSYFIFKKVKLSNMFRVIFYLPSIIPVAVLTMAFKFSFNDMYGFVNRLLEMIGVENIPVWFGSKPWAQIMVFGYCVWAGLGFNIVMLSGSMSRLPSEILEYDKLEGLTLFQELRKVVIPMVWPTITTLFILGMTSVLTVYLQPLFLTNGALKTSTIYYEIYKGVLSNSNLSYLSTFGLFCSIVYVPFIMLVRNLMNRMYEGVDY